ncbi:Fic family protein [Limosilactobacillus caccae]|uniref:Fic family protein n=1 Tax=Limosilactobacillus caccae TaxID=1926284 RepID=UPI0009703241|nr:Fic family protein [Limosilactobacillus caccae]
MKYLPLAKYKYVISDPAAIENEYQNRLNGYTSQQTTLFPLLNYKDGTQSSKYPIFFLPLPVIQNLADQLRRNSNAIKSISATLPQVAINQFLNSLLLSEIFYTNDIEGVKTSRVEISTVIQENNQQVNDKNYISKKRLGSTIKMYQRTQSGKKVEIYSLQDFRKIYDSLLKGELDQARLPNGKIFRDTLPNGEVLSIGNDLKIIHRPPITEEAIQAALTALIDYMNNDETPSIYKALVTHFFFENTHPFLDGNGRMGRYLLSSYIANKFDRFSGFSVATAIHNNVQQYYKVFKEADNAENRADLTFFIWKMLEILVSQQEKVISILHQSRDKLDNANTVIQQWVASHHAQLASAQLPDELYCDILYLLAQSMLFTNQPSLGIKDNDIIAGLKKNSPHHYPMTKTRLAIEKLEQLNAIKTVSKRPKQHIIQIF